MEPRIKVGSREIRATAKRERIAACVIAKKAVVAGAIFNIVGSDVAIGETKRSTAVTEVTN